jgi:predicted amidohydrolase
MKKLGSTTALGAGAFINGVPRGLSDGPNQGGGTGLHVHESGFSAGTGGLPAGWTTWSARPEIAPKTFIDPVHHRSGPGSLAIYGDTNASAYGGWEFKVHGVEPGKWYRFGAYYCADGVPCESWQIVSRLDWVAADGNRTGQPNYAYRVTPAGDWKQVTLDAPAPAKATGVKLQFYLANSPQGTVYWDDITLDEIAAPGPRRITVASINLQPGRTHSSEETVGLFLENIAQSVKQPTDVILLTEGMTAIRNGKEPIDVAEPIPGPTISRLAEVAKRRRTYIIAGVFEREGHTLYNVAVLLDRHGTVVGKYRKVYLPREDVEAGMTPGNHYPVFRTDFGTVGIMICWDHYYTNPARAMALQGADIIFLPAAGTYTLIERARAWENHVFLVSSVHNNHYAHIIDPAGEMVAESSASGTPASATIDLNHRYTEPWLGDMKERFMKEIRFDVRVPRIG